MITKYMATYTPRLHPDGQAKTKIVKKISMLMEFPFLLNVHFPQLPHWQRHELLGIRMRPQAL